MSHKGGGGTRRDTAGRGGKKLGKWRVAGVWAQEATHDPKNGVWRANVSQDLKNDPLQGRFLFFGVFAFCAFERAFLLGKWRVFGILGGKQKTLAKRGRRGDFGTISEPFRAYFAQWKTPEKCR